MSILKRWFSQGLQWWREQSDEQLRWRLARHQDESALRQARVLAEQALVEQLKKQSQQLEHELAISAAKNSTELAMVKIQYQQDLKDYQQYLASLDKLKLSLQASYAHLPEAVAFTIHHHAKRLLHQMWDESDPGEKLKMEVQLIKFMTAVHEDSLSALSLDDSEALPQKTLAFIDGEV